MTTATKNSTEKQPLRILFLTTSLPVGGAETLLANLVRRMDRTRFAPEIACLKERGPVGEELASEIPVYSHLIRNKYDVGVLFRLARLMKTRNVAAVVTVGAGDKMFWGRLAAWFAKVPVVLSALHSTGWPDGVGRLNRLLTPITTGFIGVADAHTAHLVDREGFPREKVHCVYNGIDVDRFVPGDGQQVRAELNVPESTPLVSILAALRPEKNHEFFLQAAQRIRQAKPQTHFLVIGDGPRRAELEELAERLEIDDCTHFVGSRSDVPQLLAASDVVTLTSHNEASPVSILEALSCAVPVVSANVGSVSETVVPGETGFLYECGNMQSYTSHTLRLLNDPQLRDEIGQRGRAFVVAQRSLHSMVEGYEKLIAGLHSSKMSQPAGIGRKLSPAKQVMDLGTT